MHEITGCYQFDLEMTLRLTLTYHQLILSDCHQGEVQTQLIKIQKFFAKKQKLIFDIVYQSRIENKIY